MPSSQYYHISKVMQIIMALNPMKVLDIGTGFGKYGVLCREYLELWDGRQKYEFSRRIDGVEVFKEYLTPLHQFIYDNIYNDNILTFIDKLEMGYDLVLLLDVLEHFEKVEGVLLLDSLLSKNTGVLISTPKKPSAQKDAFGNIYEAHRSAWSKKELSQKANTFFIPDSISFICYMTNNMDSVNNLKKGIKVLREEQLRFSLKRIKKQLVSIPLALKVYHLLTNRKPD
jgi:hypothetical protein